jgi:hypothetical protein
MWGKFGYADLPRSRRDASGLRSHRRSQSACLVSECVETGDLGLIDLLEFLGPFLIRIGIPDTHDDIFVHVAVGPAESGLNRSIELRQLDGLGSDEAARETSTSLKILLKY